MRPYTAVSSLKQGVHWTSLLIVYMFNRSVCFKNSLYSFPGLPPSLLQQLFLNCFQYVAFLRTLNPPPNMKLALIDKKIYHFQDVQFSATQLLTDNADCWKLWDLAGLDGWMKSCMVSWGSHLLKGSPSTWIIWVKRPVISSFWEFIPEMTALEIWPETTAMEI